MTNQVPKYIVNKIKETQADTIELLKSIVSSTPLNFRIGIEQECPVPLSFEDKNKRMQVCYFVRKYQLLPPGPVEKISVIFEPPFDLGIINFPARYKFQELHLMAGIINDYRTLLFNKSDIIYYKKIHALIWNLLKCQDKKEGTVFTAYDEQNNDITPVFKDYLSNSLVWIEKIIEKSDLTILYNAFLQHTDKNHEDQASSVFLAGDYQYMLLKNSILLGNIRSILQSHYNFLSSFNYQTLGSL